MGTIAERNIDYGPLLIRADTRRGGTGAENALASPPAGAWKRSTPDA